MPFIAPFIPLIASGIGAATSLLGNRRGQPQQPTPQQGGIDPALQNQLLQQQRQFAESGQSRGLAGLGRADDILGIPLDYYKRLAGGDRSLMSETLAPEIAGLNAGLETQQRNTSLMGRSGVRDLAQGDLEARKQAAISSLLFGKREGAMGSLNNISDMLRSSALQEFGTASGNLQSATGTAMNWNQFLRQLQEQERARQSALFGSIGSSIGNILPSLIGIFGGSSSSTPSTPSTNPPGWNVVL